MKTLLAALLALFAISPSFSSEKETMNDQIPSKGLAVFEAKGHFKPWEFSRRPLEDNDIQIEILYAGICHSDLHHVFGDWGKEEYPMVPGHEIAGRVVKVGKNVKRFKVGDMAGVGCMVNSCNDCDECADDHEQYCKGVVLTYHDRDQFHGNEITQGGYANNLVVTEKFAVKIPENAQLEKVAPLLCAGITTYSPIRNAGVKKGGQSRNCRIWRARTHGSSICRCSRCRSNRIRHHGTKAGRRQKDGSRPVRQRQ